MSLYVQLGHESWKLLEEPNAGQHRGLILSPVNDQASYVAERLQRLKPADKGLEVILDPQFYNPASNKGALTSWKFWSPDLETVDKGDLQWWKKRASELVEVALELGVDTVCSPAFQARIAEVDYYKLIVDIADVTAERADDEGIGTMLTAVIHLRELDDPSKAFSIASVLSSSKCRRVYLIFHYDEVQTRQPLNDAVALPTAAHLVRLLSGSGMRVHVAFCGHEATIWKGAGAEDISTGKWLNVRRFSPKRWQEEDTEGRLVPYWTDQRLITLLREQDVLRLDRLGWFPDGELATNPNSVEILDILRAGKGQPWQRLSFLQHMHYMDQLDSAVSDYESAVELLQVADGWWLEVEKNKVLFVDRFNDGLHVRIWLNALHEGHAR